jgi:RimJ/RimL family protein N-acetyltransferase
MDDPVRSELIGDAETSRLLLRRWTAEHAPGLADVNADAEVLRFINAGVPLTRRQSDLVSDRVAEHWDAYGFGLWAVVEKVTGRMIGFAGLSHPLWFRQWAHTVEVGWRLHREAWGRGYATEAAQKALELGFGRLGLEEVVAFIHPDNVRSAAVADRLGMRHDRRVPHPDRPHDLDVYRLAARDVWRSGSE